MVESLSWSGSGSYLVSMTAIHSSQIPPLLVLEGIPEIPTLDVKKRSQSRAELEAKLAMLKENLSFAQNQIQVWDGIIEGAHAQLIIQNLHQKKLHETLHAKEKKKTRWFRLFAGRKGHHLTSDEFMTAVGNVEQAKEDKDRAKSYHQKQAQDLKIAREANEKKWKEMLEKHDTAVRNWVAECAELMRKNVLKRQHPRKPKWPLKPKLQQSTRASNEGEEEEGTNDSGISTASESD